MQTRISHKWIGFGLLVFVMMGSQTERADGHILFPGEQPSAASGRLVDQERNPGVLLGPRRHNLRQYDLRQHDLRQRNAHQRPNTTLIVRGYRGLLPLQTQRRGSILAEDGSVLGDFCSVYEGLCPASRRFKLAAAPARQFIVQTALNTKYYRELQGHYRADLSLGGARYQATSDQEYATALTARMGLSTVTSHPLQQSLYLHSSFLSTSGPGQAPALSAQTVTLGYRQQYRLSGLLSSVLFGADDLVWDVAHGRSSLQGKAEDQTSVRLAQQWERTAYFVRVSLDWRRHHPPQGHLPGDYEQHSHMIDTGLNAAVSPVLGRLFAYAHIRSVGISYARSRTRFSDPFLWQTSPQDTTASKTTLMISGAYPTQNIAPFLVLEERITHQSALLAPGRRYVVSLGVAIQF